MNDIRIKIWNELVTAKYKTFFITYFNSRSEIIESYIKIFAAIATSGSVASWYFWSKFPILWAVIIGLNVIVQIVIPHISLFKNSKELIEVFAFYTIIHLQYEKLLYDYDNHKIDEDKASEIYFEYRKNEAEMLNKHQSIKIENTLIRKKSQIELEKYLNLNFNV